MRVAGWWWRLGIRLPDLAPEPVIHFHPIRYRGVENLLEMLLHYDQLSDILYFEVVDIPLPELQELRILKLAFSYAANSELETHSIRLPKESTVGDVLEHLKEKVKLSRPNAELRLLEVLSQKIYKIYHNSDKIAAINGNRWTLRAEEVPEEEKFLGPSKCLIHVCHFMHEEPDGSCAEQVASTR